MLKHYIHSFIAKLRKEPRFAIRDSAWIEKRGYGYTRLLRELIGLDYASLEGLDELSEGTATQWAPIFEKSRETWRLITNSDGAVVAYWCFFFLSDDALRNVQDGNIFDGHLQVDDVMTPIPGMRRAIYFPMMTKHPALSRNVALTRVLFRSIWLAVDELRRKGVEITEVYANAFSEDGEKVANKFGLTRRGQSAQGGHIYSGVVNQEKMGVLQRLAK